MLKIETIMKFLRNKIGTHPLGIWIALIALLLTFIAWIMQAYSLLDWENAVKLGLQNGSFSGNSTEKAMATKEQGEAIADLIWPLPIAIVALYGVIKKKFFGFVASMMEFAICIYFPLFYIFQMWDTHIETVLGAVFLWGIPSLLGIIGLWANRNIYDGS